MTTLVVLRHAKSAWPDGVADVDRPLAGRGRREAPLVGQWLRENVSVDVVVCSPAKRTRQTWQLVSEQLAGAPDFRVDDGIYDASVTDLLGVVRTLPSSAETVLLIGHNPGLTELVEFLADTEHELKTSSIAVLRGDVDWAGVGPGSMRLAAFTTPRASGQ